MEQEMLRNAQNVPQGGLLRNRLDVVDTHKS